MFKLDIICRRRRFDASTRPVCMEKLTPGLIEPLVRMGSEIITLRLQQIRGETLTPVPIVINQSSAQARHRNAICNGRSHYFPPSSLRRFYFVFEEVIQNKVL